MNPQPGQPPGAAVLGRYVLERQIARGGMSSIWTATDQKLRRAVAVKVLSSSLAENDEVRARFEREAMAVARLQSPHIVQIFDYGVDGGHPVIVMELLQGEDLRKRLKRRPRLPLPTIVDIVDQCARGLGEAHAAGIVHRDLKPGNIFFSRGRQHEVLKLLDFGVAKADGEWRSNGESTSAGQILGTPHYMSPEQARAERGVDHRTDLWSLGVIIYQLMSGQLPFKGPSAHHVILSVAKDPFHPLSLYVPDVSPDLDAFMARALARDPEHRFTSAREMAQTFAAMVQPEAIPSAPVAVAPPAPIEVEDLAGHEAPSMPTSPSFPSMPSHPSAPSQASWPSQPSAPSYPSQGTLGSTMLPADASKQPSQRYLYLWAAALVVVGCASVVGAVALWRQPSPRATGEAPASAPEDVAVEEEPGDGVASEEAAETEAADDAEGRTAEDQATGEEADETHTGGGAPADGETAADGEAADGEAVAAEPPAAPPSPKPVFKPKPKPATPPPTTPPPDPYGSRF